MNQENISEKKYVERKVKAMRKAVCCFYTYFFLGLGTTVIMLFVFKKSALFILAAYLIGYIISFVYLNFFYLKCPVCNKLFFSRLYFFEHLACGGCSVPQECKHCGADLSYYSN